MKNKLNENELKRILVEGLCVFKDVCQNYGIMWFLAYGSLIGAVRHKGFIPWDDDIDVLVPRSDYENLRKYIDDINTNSSNWELLSYTDNQEFLMPYMKFCNKRTVVTPSRFSNGFIYGISLDIFPLDFSDEPDAIIEKNVKQIKKQLHDLEHRAHKFGIIKTGFIFAVKRLIKMFFYYINNKQDELIAAYSDVDKYLSKLSKSNGANDFYSFDLYNSIWKRNMFLGENDEISYVEFEDHIFNAPYNYDAVLRVTYGNYMELPPTEEQVTRHTFEAYFK